MMLHLPQSRFLFGALGLLAAAALFPAIGCGSVVGTTPPPPPAPADWAACTAVGQCELAAKGCCGTCGTPTVNDVNGVNRTQGQAYQDDNCPGPIPPCPACASQNNPNLAAFCVQDACTAIDVRGDAVSACTTDADCRLRYSDCCESCGQASPDMVIALSQSGASVYRSQVCAPDQACDKCLATYPDTVKAICAATGHCAVVPVVPTVAACPLDPPQGQSSCATDGLVCEYGDDPRPACRPHAACEGGLWNVALPKCPAIFGPGENGCPATPTASGDCSPDGLTCDLGNGATCACGMCTGGPCSVTPHWSCAQPPGGGCPVSPPLLGTACANAALTCIYGTCGASTSAGRVCSAGLWKDEPIACPE